MNIEQLQKLCKSLPGVTEDIKWGHDLCFSIGGKMFCITGLETPLKVSLKVRDEEFEELCSTPGIVIAPYVGRYKWILVEDAEVWNKKQWEQYIKQSYELIRAQLPKKKQEEIAKSKKR
ncbi:MAG: MmcQ/YjbR family DNA-binding protein [Bacteroidia bacterium]